MEWKELEHLLSFSYLCHFICIHTKNSYHDYTISAIFTAIVYTYVLPDWNAIQL